MNTVLLAAGCALAYMAAYRLYGRFLARRIFSFVPKRRRRRIADRTASITCRPAGKSCSAIISPRSRAPGPLWGRRSA
jgi:hypothetical protein